MTVANALEVKVCKPLCGLYGYAPSEMCSQPDVPNI